jgi:predicted DCC family thiol-disulfide oxidoreductase YuxK
MNSCHHGNTVVVFNNACPLCAIQQKLLEVQDEKMDLEQQIDQKEEQIGVLVERMSDLEDQLELLSEDEDDE